MRGNVVAINSEIPEAYVVKSFRREGKHEHLSG